jgi:hypothetical protein
VTDRQKYRLFAVLLALLLLLVIAFFLFSQWAEEVSAVNSVRLAATQ